jgi:hypothetical protein
MAHIRRVLFFREPLKQIDQAERLLRQVWMTLAKIQSDGGNLAIKLPGAGMRSETPRAKSRPPASKRNRAVAGFLAFCSRPSDALGGMVVAQ